ncbi:MAG: LysM peptidoglycan-binding domain-containing protein [Alkalispirochaetaceae bacterium]
MKRLLLLLLLCPGFYAAAQEVTHRVKPGDTLYSIARSYGVPLQLILEENNIDDPGQLTVGRELAIPGTHLVSPGETLFGISRRYGVEVGALRAANDLDSDTIVVGQRLTLPTGAIRPEREGEQQDAEGEESEPASPTVFQQRVVAETMTRPLGFAEGSSWPVAGERYEMEGKLPGVIIQGETGDPVTSVSSGRVIYAGPHTSFGNVVFIQSALGYIYVYGGNEAVDVSVGDEVAPGSRIGTLGNSPAQQRALLYFSIWKENDFVSPDQAPRG